MSKTKKQKKNTQYLLSYLQKHQKIAHGDMLTIQQKTGWSIPEQMSALRALSKEGRIEDRSVNWWEPVFYAMSERERRIEAWIQQEEMLQSQQGVEHLLRYIRVSNGNFNSFDLYFDYGLPPQAQKSLIRQLLEEERIEPFKQGYRIVSS